ncbi:hypothetical protein BDV10DRAFT_157521 [Aspergillus recurvatus]
MRGGGFGLLGILIIDCRQPCGSDLGSAGMCHRLGRHIGRNGTLGGLEEATAYSAGGKEPVDTAILSLSYLVLFERILSKQPANACPEDQQTPHRSNASTISVTQCRHDESCPSRLQAHLFEGQLTSLKLIDTYNILRTFPEACRFLH